jgi:outer membrane biogenesis lipoprotein LolB
MSIIISQIDGYKEFRQNNWTVKINKYQNIDSYDLPKNIQARNTTSNLRIIIDKWRL